MPGRECSICSHPEVNAINEALVLDGASYRNLSERFGVSLGAINRHTEHIRELMRKASRDLEIATADQLQDAIRRYTVFADKLLDACDRWLTDPDNPDQYDLGPRAEEVKVTYQTKGGARRKANLSDLLARIEEGTGTTAVTVETKHADPRTLLLRAVGELRDQITVLARLLGEIQDAGTTINVIQNPVLARSNGNRGGP